MPSQSEYSCMSQACRQVLWVTEFVCLWSVMADCFLLLSATVSTWESAFNTAGQAHSWVLCLPCLGALLCLVHQFHPLCFFWDCIYFHQIGHSDFNAPIFCRGNDKTCLFVCFLNIVHFFCTFQLCLYGNYSLEIYFHKHYLKCHGARALQNHIQCTWVPIFLNNKWKYDFQ